MSKTTAADLKPGSGSRWIALLSETKMTQFSRSFSTVYVWRAQWLDLHGDGGMSLSFPSTLRVVFRIFKQFNIYTQKITPVLHTFVPFPFNCSTCAVLHSYLTGLALNFSRWIISSWEISTSVSTSKTGWKLAWFLRTECYVKGYKCNNESKFHQYIILQNSLFHMHGTN